MGADSDCTGRSCLSTSNRLQSTSGRVAVVALGVCRSLGMLLLTVGYVLSKLEKQNQA